MDKENVEQGQGRDPVPQETEGIKEKRSFHIQIIHGKDQTEV
jgi:hypothetical protein